MADFHVLLFFVKHVRILYFCSDYILMQSSAPHADSKYNIGGALTPEMKRWHINKLPFTSYTTLLHQKADITPPIEHCYVYWIHNCGFRLIILHNYTAGEGVPCCSHLINRCLAPPLSVKLFLRSHKAFHCKTSILQVTLQHKSFSAVR